MYIDFFGLRELPFNNTPDPRFFFSTHDHEEALASLIYAVEGRKGFVLLTGEVGAGKTLVSRLMLRHFGSRIAFANINHSVQSAHDLMEALCTEFDLDVPNQTTHAQLVRVLHDFLLARFAQNIPVVLVLDEAQNVPIDAFEQLRMIGNLEADDAKLLQICIVGQPELQTRFGTADLRQLRQRLYRSYHLPALNQEATEGYMRHRLSVSGGKIEDVFTHEAIETVFQLSRGLPRLINTICDNAMLSAYAADNRTIDDAFVRTVTAQMMLVDTGDPTASKPPSNTRHSVHQVSAGTRQRAAGGGYVTETLSPTETSVPSAQAPRQIRLTPSGDTRTATPRLANRRMLDRQPDRIVNLVRGELGRLRMELSRFLGHTVQRVDALERRWLSGTSATDRAPGPRDGPNAALIRAAAIVKRAETTATALGRSKRDRRAPVHEARSDNDNLLRRRKRDDAAAPKSPAPSAADVDAVVRRLDANARTTDSLLRAWRTSEMKSSATVQHTTRTADGPNGSTAQTASNDIGPLSSNSRDAYLARLRHVIETVSGPPTPPSP